MSDSNLLILTIGIVIIGILVIFVPAILLQRRMNRKIADGSVTPRASPMYPNLTALKALPPESRLETMRKAIRHWAWIEIVIGSLSLIAGLAIGEPYGIIQILIGLSSFFFHSDYPMFILYAWVFLWAGILSLVGGSGTWSFIGLVQFYWAFTNFQQFRLYRSAAKEIKQASQPIAEQGISANAPPPLWGKPDEEDSRAARYFPWLALGLSGGGSMVFAVLYFASYLGLGILNSMPIVYAFISHASMLVGIIGVPYGVSSLLSGYNYKQASVAAVGLGGLMLALYLWFIIAPRL